MVCAGRPDTDNCLVRMFMLPREICHQGWLDDRATEKPKKNLAEFDKFCYCLVEPSLLQKWLVDSDWCWADIYIFIISFSLPLEWRWQRAGVQWPAPGCPVVRKRLPKPICLQCLHQAVQLQQVDQRYNGQEQSHPGASCTKRVNTGVNVDSVHLYWEVKIFLIHKIKVWLLDPYIW